ncbi:hypothetical protein H1R20_g12327, partial [Candolleomyces eurysporus]
MKFSYAAAALLLAGSASASAIEGLFRRQSVQDMLAAIPPACQTPCQPLVSLESTCGSDPNPQRCACTQKTLDDMETCVTCVVREVTSASGGSGLDPATLQTAIDTAMESFLDTCKAAGVDLANGGGSSSGTTGTTAAGTATNTSPAAANTSGSSSNQNGGSSNQGSGASRVEFAASALVAVAAGAALLI